MRKRRDLIMYLRKALGVCVSLGLFVWAGLGSPCKSYASGDAEAGKAVYEKRCLGCHGEKGDGKGLAAVFLYPKPRDFTAGKFAIRSTPTGQMPTDDDLLKTLTNGIPGSSMPAFNYIPEDERRNAIAYLKTLAVYYDEEEDETYNLFELRGTPTPIVVPEPPSFGPETLNKAKAVYDNEQLGCVKCHGRLGKGDGPSAAEQVDDWNRPIKVRDFTTGVFKGGGTPKDIYTRFATGLTGTSMPAFSGEQMSDEDRWLVVQYVLSLKDPDVKVVPLPSDLTITADNTNKDIPIDDPYDKVWDEAKVYEIPLNELFQPEINPMHVRVRALETDKELALLLEWDDENENLINQKSESYRDACAVQFSPGGEFPFIGMGNSKKRTGEDIAVNIWHWKGDWQHDEGHYVEIRHVYPQMHVDTYYHPKELQDKTYMSGRAAGNLFSQEHRQSPVEDLNAIGFGSLTSQGEAGQNVKGKGVYFEGTWRVLFKRPLSSSEAKDAKFSKGSTIPISVAVWHGDRGDRNGQKAVSTWYRLKL
ncbi:MAG: ethylbenzene dehydrogenase-related protein [Candidatus Brocadiales bacterium]